MCIPMPLIHVNRGMGGSLDDLPTKTIAGAAETAYFDGAAASGAASNRAATREMGLSDPVLIKRYDGRRLYRPDAGTYLTLDDLAAMVEDDTPFTVREAATGEDITPSILQQITS